MKPVILAVSLFLLLSFSVASAQLTKMAVGYSAITAAHLPAWLAKETEIFAKNGLDVQLVYMRAGATAVMALVSKETPISQLGGPAIVSAQGGYPQELVQRYSHRFSLYAMPNSSHRSGEKYQDRHYQS